MNLNTKTVASLKYVLLVAVLVLIGVVALASHVFAASTTFTNGNYNSNDSVSSGDTSRFAFIDPYLIQDTQTKFQGDPSVNGTNDSVSNHVLYSTSANNAVFDEPGFYFYWPGGDVLGSKGSQCAAGLMLQVSSSKRWTLYLFQPTQGANGCIVTGADGSALSASTVSGFQAWQNGAACGKGGCVGSSANGAFITIENSGVNLGGSQSEVMPGATFLRWVSPTEIDSYDFAGSVQLTPLDPSNPAYGQITKQGGSKFTDGSYTIFTNLGACINSDGLSVQAFVAVKKGAPPYLAGQILSNDGTPGNAYTTNWYGSHQVCLTGGSSKTGGTAYDPSPAVAWGGTRNDAFIGIADAANSVKAGSAPTGIGTGSSSGNSSGSDSTPTLSCHAGWNPLNWLLCGLVQGMVTIVGQLDNLIMSQLAVGVPHNNTNGSPSLIFGNGASAQAYKAAWTSFRNIALALMVIAGLVVIIAQALGFEALDAYTIRKVLPRFLAAAIFITLSWPLMQFFIQFTNEIGYGIRNLIYAPFVHAGLNVSLDLGGAGDFAITLLAAGGILAFGIVGLLTFAVAAALSVFVAYMTLVIRQILIVALVILAPIAIACYILPNTQRVYTLWWESFSKALLMFPIIAAIIAVGHVFAAVSVSGPNPGAINEVVALAAYFAPYFLIPATFRFAGMALSGVSNLINSRARGGYAALGRVRSSRVQKRGKNASERARSGTTFKNAPNGSKRDALNKAIQRGTLAGKAGYRPSRWKGNVESALAAANLEAGLEKAESLPGAKSFFASDDLMGAGVEGRGDYDKTVAYLSRAKDEGGAGWTLDQARIGAAEALRLRGQMGAQAFDLAAAAKLPATGTYAEEENIGQWHQLVARATGGNKSLQASVIAQGKAGFRAAQRYEVSEAGFGDHLAAVAMAEQHGKAEDISSFIVKKSLASGGAAAVVGSRNDKVARMYVQAYREMLQEAEASGDPNQVTRVLALGANIQDQMAGGKKIVTDVLSQELFGYQINGRTVLDQINEKRSDPTFQQTRRELGREGLTPEQAAQLQSQAGTQTPGSTPTPPVGGGLPPPV